MVPSSQPSGAQHQWSCGAASCHHCPSRAMLCDRSASCCCAQLPGTPWPHCRGWGPWQSHSPLGVPFQSSAGGAGPQSILLCAVGSWVPTARCPLLQLCHSLPESLCRVRQRCSQLRDNYCASLLCPIAASGLHWRRSWDGILQAVPAAAEPGCLETLHLRICSGVRDCLMPAGCF